MLYPGFIPAAYHLPILLLGILLLGTIFFLYLKLLRTIKEKEKAEKKFRQLESNVNALQLQSLESRLSPHLFKNILNSIQSHAYQTYYSLDKLAHVLDYILYESKKSYVTPKEEIDFALHLVEINRIKLSPLFELRVRRKIGDSEPLYEQRLLAPLISIDLIENAFKHADLQQPDSFIAISFEFRDSSFSLTVSNKVSEKKSLRKEKSGIGLETLKSRLKIIYGENFKLEHFVQDDTYVANLKINLFEHKAKMLAAR